MNQFEFPGMKPSYQTPEPRDIESRAKLWHDKLSAVCRTLDYVRNQIWSEPLFWFDVNRDDVIMRGFHSLRWHFKGNILHKDIFTADARLSLRENVYDLVWSQLWKLSRSEAWWIIPSPRSTKVAPNNFREVAVAIGTREGFLRRFVEEARSEEARALFDLEQMAGGRP